MWVSDLKIASLRRTRTECRAYVSFIMEVCVLINYAFEPNSWYRCRGCCLGAKKFHFVDEQNTGISLFLFPAMLFTRIRKQNINFERMALGVRFWTMRMSRCDSANDVKTFRSPYTLDEFYEQNNNHKIKLNNQNWRWRRSFCDCVSVCVSRNNKKVGAPEKECK